MKKTIIVIFVVLLTLVLSANADIIINEILADPAAGLGGDANGDGTRDSYDDEFIEIVNTGAEEKDISGWALSDSADVRHVFPVGTIIPADCAVVVFGGGSPAGDFGQVLVQTSSTGSLGLNNGGDTVTIGDGLSVLSIASFGSDGGFDQSLTLYPDIIGLLPLVKHSTAMGSEGRLFSPGTKSDGTMFSGCIDEGQDGDEEEEIPEFNAVAIPLMILISGIYMAMKRRNQ
ncbi:MAG: lamin tail domain-containing protein [Nanoarchaeota archaeon]|nr:lamin tail domain-containing protein [Nanoarchaeota archaeon]